MVQRQYVDYCVRHWHKHKLLVKQISQGSCFGLGAVKQELASDLVL